MTLDRSSRQREDADRSIEADRRDSQRACPPWRTELPGASLPQAEQSARTGAAAPAALGRRGVGEQRQALLVALAAREWRRPRPLLPTGMARVARRPRQSPQLRAGEAVVGRDAERACPQSETRQDAPGTEEARRRVQRAVDDLDNLPRHSVGERRVPEGNESLRARTSPRSSVSGGGAAPSGGGRSDELVERGGGEGERTAGHLVPAHAPAGEEAPVTGGRARRTPSHRRTPSDQTSLAGPRARRPSTESRQ